MSGGQASPAKIDDTEAPVVRVPDAHLAALAIEHGAEIISTDTDFARFTEIRWRNPLAGSQAVERAHPPAG